MSDDFPGLNRKFNLLHFANQNLTAISVGVLVVGVVLVFVAGPGRTLLTQDAAPVEPEAVEEIAAVVQPAGVAFSPGTGGATTDVEVLLDRAPVPFTIIPDRQRDEVVSYTVESGDTIFDLADQYSLNMETIFWANSDTLQDNVHLLVPGVEIFILPTNGIYYRASGEETIEEIAAKFFADPNQILDPTYNGELPADSGLTFVPPLGMRLIVPGGEREQIDFAWSAPAPGAAGGDGSQSQTVVFAPGHPGSCNTPIGNGLGSGVWGSPVNSYSLSQGFFYGHTGVDLSSVVGEPVFAADSGQVVFAGWNDWGYGNLVAVNHGLWTTLYAHLNSVGVGCGQTITRGTPIGSIGSTGNSTGPHLHFEMRFGLGLNPDNPAAYMGF